MSSAPIKTRSARLSVAEIAHLRYDPVSTISSKKEGGRIIVIIKGVSSPNMSAGEEKET